MTAQTIQVFFLNHDKTAKTAGIDGVRKSADDFVKGRVKEFLTHAPVRKTLGFSEAPTFKFLNSFPYNTVVSDYGVHINFVGGSKCLHSRCALILGKTTNSQGKNVAYGVAYNAQGEVILRGGPDVAIGKANAC